jgi:hypothetical protein
MWLIIIGERAAIPALYFIWGIAPSFILVPVLLVILPTCILYYRYRQRRDLFTFCISVCSSAIVVLEAIAFWFFPESPRWSGPGG